MPQIFPTTDPVPPTWMPSRTQNCSTIIFLFFSYLFSSICKTDWLFDWLTDWKSGAGKPSRHVTSHPGKLSLAIPPWCSWCLAQGKRIADQRCAFLLLIWDRSSERQTDKRTERQIDIITISYRVAQKNGANLSHCIWITSSPSARHEWWLYSRSLPVYSPGQAGVCKPSLVRLLFCKRRQ